MQDRVGELAAAPVDALDAFPVVFLESLEALEAARGKGLKADARVAGLSPALALQQRQPVRVLDAPLSGGRLRDFIDEMAAFAEDLSRQWPAGATPPLAATIASRHSVVFCVQTLLKAAMLEPADFEEPRAVLQGVVPGGDGDVTAGWIWPTLLADNPKLEIWRLPVRPRVPGEAVGGFLDRLRLSPRARMIALLRRLSGLLPSWPGRGTVLVLTENELLRETVLHLAAAGVRPEWVEIEVPRRRDAADAQEEAVLTRAGEILAPFAERWLCPQVRPVVARLYRDGLLAELHYERDVEAAWEAHFAARRDRGRPRGLVLNFPKGSMGPGMLAAARRHRIPVFSFRHGATHEFGALGHVDQAYLETGASDIAFCYNEAAAAVLDAVPNAVGRAVAVGMPKDYFDTGTYRRPRAGAAPLAYISTNLYCSYSVFPTAGVNDVDRMAPEIALIERVFARLPHRLLYKTYPAQSYLDPDPVIAQAERHGNIEVFADKLNAAYLFADARVLITARASSTVAHCLMSGKPVVFIDFPEHLPLMDEARALFAEGLFFFDYRDADMPERLCAFLSQPIETIEEEWRRRAAARERLIDRYFSSGRRDAGRRAAALIRREMIRAAATTT